jgi:hypothetical protein
MARLQAELTSDVRVALLSHNLLQFLSPKGNQRGLHPLLAARAPKVDVPLFQDVKRDVSKNQTEHAFRSLPLSQLFGDRGDSFDLLDDFIHHFVMKRSVTFFSESSLSEAWERKRATDRVHKTSKTVKTRLFTDRSPRCRPQVTLGSKKANKYNALHRPCPPLR